MSLPRLLLLAVCCVVPAAARAAESFPAEAAARIDDAVGQAIRRGELPGAVVLLVHRDAVVFRKAYGLRSRQPAEVPMTVDTVFDLASLTKPIATATSVMLLVEEGKLRVSDPVAHYLPAFAQNGKDGITVEQLLLHTSGLEADDPLTDYRDGPQKALERIYALKPESEPGTRFRYSDLNYIVLGELVGRVAGEPLDRFAREHIFTPLGMTDTAFRPDARLRARAAPTERREGRWMGGEVHDPRAYALGGVAGHAGLFSTADDLARYARMLLRGGELDGKRILAPATVKAMTTPRPVPGGLRALGWDVDTRYSSNRGTVFPRGRSFGHTGFTGTSIWIDPTSDTAVIFLSNRVHPDGKGNVTRLRGQVATIAAAVFADKETRRQGDKETRRNGGDRRREGEVSGGDAAGGSSPGTRGSSVSLSPCLPVSLSTLAGIDVLEREGFARLKGRRLGLVTNHTGRDRDGRSTIDLLHHAEGVTLVALFSPEHGIRGAADAKVDDGRDERTGLPVYSLYGARRRPDAASLRGIDTLVFDIQDAGCRFYTYITTLGYVLEAAAENKVKVLVLDRPNPIGGVEVEGPVLDAGSESFVGYHALPVRYGLTLGELALLYNAERKIGADVEVVRLEGWRRGDLYDRTGLEWVNPSPNLRSLTEALLYPGVGLLETTNVSVGRGTDRPFEWVGAPWLDGRRLAALLREQELPGVRFVPLRLTPAASTHRGRECGGVQVIVDDWARFRPVRTGLAIAWALHRLYPDQWQGERFNVLLGYRATWEGLRQGRPWQELEQGWQADLGRFRDRRRQYELYPD